MGLMGSGGRRAGTLVAARAVGGGRAAEVRPAAQAGSRHLQRRSIRVMPARPSGAAAVRRGGAEVAEDVLEAVVAEHRALEAGRADVDAEQVEQVVGADGRDLGERLALDLVGQQDGAGLADGAAAAGEPDAVHDPVLDAEHQRDAVAAQRVGALVRGVGVLDDPEVVGPPVVLEDVVAVEVVHARFESSANVQSRPAGSGLDRALGPCRA